MARVAFCQDSLIEYMGFMQMSAVLKAHGHVVDVFIDDGLHADRFIRDVERFRPDIIGYSVLTPSRAWAAGSAQELHSRTGAVTVCGNVDAILNTEDIARTGAFDLICTGEGEHCLLELCRRLDAGQPWTDIDGFWAVTPDGVVRNPMVAELVDMEELPPADRAMYDKFRFFRRSPYLRVYAGRGCPFRCSFCSNTTMTEAYGGSRYLRKREPASFVAELEELIASRPNEIKRIFIIDEVLWFDLEWLREFLTLYRDRIGVPFTMHFKFNGGITEDDVRLMGEAGAVAVVVAAETGDESLRRGLMNKPVSNAHILQVGRWMKRHGVGYGATAFFGLPDQTFEHHIEELDFYREFGGSYLWSTFFQPYPGLKLTEHPEVAPLLAGDEDFGSTLHTEMHLDVPDRIRLVNLKKVYYLMFRFPWTTRPLAWLCRFRIPFLFDAIFAMHFTYYYLTWEGCSLYQFLVHAKDYGLNPVLRRRQALNMSGRPFDPGYGPPDATPRPTAEDSAPRTRRRGSPIPVVVSLAGRDQKST